jgi:hypothetical protein
VLKTIKKLNFQIRYQYFKIKFRLFVLQKNLNWIFREHQYEVLKTGLADYDSEIAWLILADALIGKYGFINDTAAELLYQRDKVRSVKPLISAFAYSHLGNEWKPSVDEGKLIEILKRIGEPAFDDLISALNHPHIDIRNGAAKTLKKLGDKRAVEALWKVKDNTPYAIVAIAHLDYERAVGALIERLDLSNPKSSYAYLDEIIDILSEHREVRAVDGIASHLEKSKTVTVLFYPPFFANIETTLKKIGTPQALKTVENFRAYMDNPENREKELAESNTEEFRAFFESRQSWFKRIRNKLIFFHRNR